MSFMSTVFAYCIQRLVFEPPRTPGYLEHEAVYVKTQDGQKIATMLIRPVAPVCSRQFDEFDEVENLIDLCNVPATPARVCPPPLPKLRPLLLYSHSNAEDIGTSLEYSQWLATNLDCDVLVYDYIGYGHSSVALMSEANMYQAIDAVFEHAFRHYTQHSGLFIMGRSLGSTASTYLARRLGEREREDGCRQYKGLVLLSPLASGFRVLFDVGEGSSTMIAMMDRLFGPVLYNVELANEAVFIIHGLQDEVIDIRNAYEIQAHVQARCSFPPLFVDAGHNDVDILHGARMLSQLRHFMWQCAPSSIERLFAGCFDKCLRLCISRRSSRVQ